MKRKRLTAAAEIVVRKSNQASVFSKRTIILFTGRVVDGKTSYLNAAQKALGPFPFVSDYDSVAQAVARDHEETGGINHVHPLEAEERLGVCHTGQGHSHAMGDSIRPFPCIATGQNIVLWMWQDFFARLNTVAQSSTPVLAELAAGKNGFPKNSPSANVDFSYTFLAKSFREKTFPASILKRLALCIHVHSDDTVRQKRLQSRSDISQEVLQLYAIDDFGGLFTALLRENNIPVVEINNTDYHSKTEMETVIRNKILHNCPQLFSKLSDA